MINLTHVKQYCKDPIEWIENYQEAVNDQTKTWHCHHIYELEYNLSKIELQAMGFYFNRPFHELIFLTPKEHSILHRIGKVGPNKGKQFTEEWRQRISESKKGRNHPNYGKEGYWKGKVGPNKGKDKYCITIEELYDLYVVQELSQNQIAEMYGCTQTAIWHKLKKCNIKKWI